ARLARAARRPPRLARRARRAARGAGGGARVAAPGARLPWQSGARHGRAPARAGDRRAPVVPALARVAPGARVRPRHLPRRPGAPPPPLPEPRLLPRVRVRKRAQVDVRHDRARVAYEVASGPPSVFGEVRVTGTRAVDPEVVRRELAFRPGEPFKASLVERTRSNLVALRLFRTIRID